jgi:hypothetical protein
MAMAKSVNTNRIFLLLAGVVVAIFIAWQAQSLVNVIGNRLAVQKVNTFETSTLLSLPDILLQGWTVGQRIIKQFAN